MANAYQRIASAEEYKNVPPGMLILHRFGGWLPRDHRVLQKWLDKRIAALDERNQKGVEVEQQIVAGWNNSIVYWRIR